MKNPYAVDHPLHSVWNNMESNQKSVLAFTDDIERLTKRRSEFMEKVRKYEEFFADYEENKK